MMDFRIRRAEPKDRPRLLEISSQIWEGDDYIPDVIDAWIADPDGELAVAVQQSSTGASGFVVGFARCSRLAPSFAWLEGARTDPVHRNRGASKALLEYFLAGLRDRNVRTVALSTYVENKASIHIIEREGFRCVEEYVYAERITTPENAPGKTVSRRDKAIISPIDGGEALDLLGSLGDGIRFLPDGWKFIPVELGLQLFEARVELLGAYRQRRLSAMASVSRSGIATGFLSVGLYAMLPEDAACLLHEVESRFPIERSELMLWPAPTSGDVLDVVRNRGYSVWNEGRSDVFVYELALTA